MENTKNSGAFTPNKSKNVFFNEKIQKKLIRKTFSCYSRNAFEAIKAAGISGIPKIYEIEEDEENLYVTEEYIDGNNLEELLENGKKFTEQEACGIVLRVGEILSALHKIDPPIVHRDIKPANIMTDSNGNVYLIDFDAAKAYSPNEFRDTVLIGTEGFAAPEQYGFKSSDSRTDIYSLGVTFNYLLTGFFPGEKLCDGKYAEVISKATEMDPKYRYPSIDDMIYAIQNAGNVKKKVSKFIFLFPVLLLAAVCILVFPKLSGNKVKSGEMSEISQTDFEEIPSDLPENDETVICHGDKVKLPDNLVFSDYPDFYEGKLGSETVLPHSDKSKTYYLGIKDLRHGESWYFGGGMGRNEPTPVAFELIPWAFTKENGSFVPVSEDTMKDFHSLYDFKIKLYPMENNTADSFPLIRYFEDGGIGRTQIGFDEESSGSWVVSCQAVSKENQNCYTYFTRQNLDFTKIHSYDLTEIDNIDTLNQKLSDIVSEVSDLDIDTNIIEIHLFPGTFEGEIRIPAGHCHLRLIPEGHESGGKNITLNGKIVSDCTCLDVIGFHFNGAGKENEFWPAGSILSGKSNTGISGKSETIVSDSVLDGYFIARDGKESWNWGNDDTIIQNCHTGVYFDIGAADGGNLEMKRTEFIGCDTAIYMTGQSSRFSSGDFMLNDVIFTENGQDIIDESIRKQS